MGVYYNAYAVFGLKVNEDDLPLEEGQFYREWLETDLPAGYEFTIGGSFYDDSPTYVVIAKPKHIVKLFSYEDYGHDSGGVKKLSDFVSVTKQDVYDLVDLAEEFSVSHKNVDFWLVSLWS